MFRVSCISVQQNLSSEQEVATWGWAFQSKGQQGKDVKKGMSWQSLEVKRENRGTLAALYWVILRGAGRVALSK